MQSRFKSRGTKFFTGSWSGAARGAYKTSGPRGRTCCLKTCPQAVHGSGWVHGCIIPKSHPLEKGNTGIHQCSPDHTREGGSLLSLPRLDCGPLEAASRYLSVQIEVSG